MFDKKPYLIRAIYEWCCDNELTPYCAALIDEYIDIPSYLMGTDEVVLDISPIATQGLVIDNDSITCKLGFDDGIHDIYIPVKSVIAIFAQETGDGLNFDVILGDDIQEPEYESDDVIKILK